MKKILRSTKRRVMHPLHCWDIILNQLSTLPHRWDLMIVEKKKAQYNWKMDFSSLLKNRYHSFLVIDSSYRICCQSKKFAEFLRDRSHLSSFVQVNEFLQRLRRFFGDQPLDASDAISLTDITPNFLIEIFPITTQENRCIHFFVLIKREANKQGN